MLNGPGDEDTDETVVTEAKDKSDEHFSREVVLYVAEAFLESGHVKTQGRSDEEIARDLRAAIREFVEDEDDPLMASIDFRDELLEEASRLLQSDKPLIACLLYATWLEHWLNAMIFTIGERSGISYDDLARRVGKSNIHQKLDRLLPELGVPQISGEHDARIRKVVRLRNDYVHYKWERNDIDSDVVERSEADLVTTLREIDQTVRYLIELERSQLTGVDRERLTELLGLRKDPDPKAAKTE